ncbi:MAG: adenine phosphoribosyltransferase [Candidatus Nanoarchaeia archaeon]
MNKDSEYIKSKIRTIPDYPKKGIMFRDITTLLNDSEAFRKTLQIFKNRYINKGIDVVAGIESRGFIFGGALAEKIGANFVPIRKKGKLPYETVSEEYDLEYGKDRIEIHKDSIKPMQKVLIMDDLIATGGTVKAACSLVEKIGGNIVECAFVIELPELKGREKLNKPYFSIVKFEGE